jgi:hypothetical protein
MITAQTAMASIISTTVLWRLPITSSSDKDELAGALGGMLEPPRQGLDIALTPYDGPGRQRRLNSIWAVFEPFGCVPERAPDCIVLK